MYTYYFDEHTTDGIKSLKKLNIPGLVEITEAEYNHKLNILPVISAPIINNTDIINNVETEVELTKKEKDFIIMYKTLKLKGLI